VWIGDSSVLSRGEDGEHLFVSVSSKVAGDRRLLAAATEVHSAVLFTEITSSTFVSGDGMASTLCEIKPATLYQDLFTAAIRPLAILDGYVVSSERVEMVTENDDDTNHEEVEHATFSQVTFINVSSTDPNFAAKSVVVPNAIDVFQLITLSPMHVGVLYNVRLPPVPNDYASGPRFFSQTGSISCRKWEYGLRMYNNQPIPWPWEICTSDQL
jgi:hypothetical protein